MNRLLMKVVLSVAIAMLAGDARAEAADASPLKDVPRNTVQDEIAWGEAVEGLRVGISLEKHRFDMDEPIPVHWQIKNTSQADKTIIWHELHYSPVVFEIGRAGEKKSIRDDARRYFNLRIPGPPEKLILKPGEAKAATFDLRRFGLRGSSLEGAYDITGLYWPEKAGRLADDGLKQSEFSDCFAGRIRSAQLKITLTDRLIWLRNQLRQADFHDRLQAARRLTPILGNEQVLAELEKMYPPENTRQMVSLVDHMAEFGDRSHVADVLDMYEAGGYAPFENGSGDDMLVFLLKWGQGRGIRQLCRYLEQNRDAQKGTAKYRAKRSLLEALTEGFLRAPYFDFQPNERVLPLLVLTLGDKTVRGGLTLESGEKVIARWCDSAALSIQKMLKRDWGFKLELAEDDRDGVIARMQSALAGHVPVLPELKPRAQFKPIDFTHGGGFSQGLMLAVNPIQASFRMDEDIVLGFYMHNPRGAAKLYCVYPDACWQWTSLIIQDSYGKRLEMPVREPANKMRSPLKEDFAAIPPGKTIYWEQTFKRAWLPKGQLRPDRYMFFVSINKTKPMSFCIPGYEEHCRRYYLSAYKGTPQTGPVLIEIVSGKDPADETLSERLERSFYFDTKQVEHQGKPCISFYLQYSGIQSLPSISVDDLMISRHIKRLSLAGISVKLGDFEDLPISEGRTRVGLFSPEEIEGLNDLKPGKYPVRLVLEGDIYKAGQADHPLEHWQVEFQEDIQLNDQIFGLQQRP